MRFALWPSTHRKPIVKIIAGLGNPGAEYSDTRHNIGFAVIDRLSERSHIPVARRAHRSLVGQGRVGSESVILMKPQTFMNLSGDAVAEALRFFRLAPSDLIVVCDDANLPSGRLRIRSEGSHGGQNGLRSIIDRLGTEAFPRLRVGIGRPTGERPLTDHVLGRWDREERESLTEVCDRAADAVAVAISEGVETAMNRFNGAP